MAKRDPDDLDRNDAEQIEQYKHLGTITDKVKATIYQYDGKLYCYKYFKNESKLRKFLDNLNSSQEDDAKFYAII